MRPLFTIASAAALTLSAETVWAKQFQRSSPVRVSAIVSPPHLNFRLAFRVRFSRPMLQCIHPVSSKRRNPAGLGIELQTFRKIGAKKPSDGYQSRRREQERRAGPDAKNLSALMRGLREAGGVKMTAASTGRSSLPTSLAVVSNFASANPRDHKKSVAGIAHFQKQRF